MAWTRWLRGKQRHSLSPVRSRACRPAVETLESRIVPYSKLFTVETGELDIFVNGSSAESITISSSKVDDFIRINGQLAIDPSGLGPNHELTISQLKVIYLQGGAGNDTLTVQSTNDAFVGRVMKIDGKDGNDLITVSTEDDAFYEMNGGAGNDTLVGGSGADNLNGNAGDDSISGGSGNDALNGGEGNDTLQGGDNDDYLQGDLGDDSIDGGAGNDFLSAGDGNDTLLGGIDNDTLQGGDGNDLLLGDMGDDNLEGGNGNDKFVFTNDWGHDTVSDSGAALSGALGFSDGDGLWFLDVTSDLTCDISKTGITVTETGPVLVVNPSTVTHSGNALEFLATGQGNDTFHMLDLPTTPTLSLYGGTGLNTLDYSIFSTAVTVNLGQTQTALNDKTFFQGTATATRAIGGIDNVLGGIGNDTLIGNNNANLLDGGAGDDNLAGAGGNDVLEGRSGNDNLDGGWGNDTYLFRGSGLGRDTVSEIGFNVDQDTLDFSGFDAGNNTGVKMQLGAITLQTVNAGNLELTFANTSSFEKVIGTPFADSLAGGANAEWLLGDAGNDTLSGGLGNDTLDGGDGTDRLIETGNVNFALADTKLTGLGTDTLTSIEEAALTGGLGNNKLDAGAFSGPVTLSGGAGNDTLTSGKGDDLLDGGMGNDMYVFGPSAAPQTDRVAEAAGGGTDQLNFVGLAAGDNLTVNLGSDTELAKHSNRTIQTMLSGQAAFFEQAVGGAGNDTFTGNAAANLLIGGTGNDLLQGSAGNDTLTGGLGDDTYAFGLAAKLQTVTVTELANQGKDLLDFSALPNTQTVKVNLGLDTLATAGKLTVQTAALGQFVNWEQAMGGAGNDTINGNGAANTLSGGLGNDLLQGMGGNDALFGNDGDDMLLGGAGNDLLDGGAGTDQGTVVGTVAVDFLTVSWDGGASRLVIQRKAAMANGLPAANPAETDQATGLETLAINALAGNDHIDLSALSKADVTAAGLIRTLLSGGMGSDAITGGGAIDRLVEAADVSFTLTNSKLTGVGTDTLLSIEEAELTGGISNNKIITSAFSGSVTLRGGAGNDQLTSGFGSDLLDGGAGIDILNGGAGTDVGINGETLINIP